MNKYIRKSLEEGEEIVFNGRLHWSYIWGYIFWEWVLLIGAIALAIYNYRREESSSALYYCALAMLLLAVVVWLIGKVVRNYSEFVVTATRFIQKDGFLSIHMKEIPLFKIETVNYHQKLIQRIIGTGGIELVGSGGTYHLIENIDKPMEVRRAIVSAINRNGSRNADDVPASKQYANTYTASYERADSDWTPDPADDNSPSLLHEEEE